MAREARGARRRKFRNGNGSCFKALDHGRGQGAPRLESGAYMPVREHFKRWGNAASFVGSKPLWSF